MIFNRAIEREKNKQEKRFHLNLQWINLSTKQDMRWTSVLGEGMENSLLVSFNF